MLDHNAIIQQTRCLALKAVLRKILQLRVFTYHGARFIQTIWTAEQSHHNQVERLTMIEQIQAETRGDRRKRRTRQALIEATLTLISERGIDQFTVSDVTETADVALATAYNYFDSKEALICEAMESVMRDLAEKIEQAVQQFPDPSFAFPYGLITLLNAMTFDERFRWLYQRPDSLSRSMSRCFGPYCKNDMQRGIDVGRYQVDDLETAWRTVCWSAVGISSAVAQGDLPRKALTTTVVNFIVMLGLSQQEAAELFAQLPPPLEIS